MSRDEARACARARAQRRLPAAVWSGRAVSAYRLRGGVVELHVADAIDLIHVDREVEGARAGGELHRTGGVADRVGPRCREGDVALPHVGERVDARGGGGGGPHGIESVEKRRNQRRTERVEARLVALKRARLRIAACTERAPRTHACRRERRAHLLRARGGGRRGGLDGERAERDNAHAHDCGERDHDGAPARRRGRVGYRR